MVQFNLECHGVTVNLNDIMLVVKKGQGVQDGQRQR
jgi:hypothetical protein